MFKLCEMPSEHKPWSLSSEISSYAHVFCFIEPRECGSNAFHVWTRVLSAGKLKYDGQIPACHAVPKFSGLKQLLFYLLKILCSNSFGCTRVVLLLVSPGITHVAAVLWQPLWGWVIAGDLGSMSGSWCWASGWATCFQQARPDFFMGRRHSKTANSGYQWLSSLYFHPF